MVAQPVEETLIAFIDLVDQSPDRADVAALALRDQGRAGRLTTSHLEALIAFLFIAPNSLCVGHLAKALGSMGRAAMPASDALIERMGKMLITDDVEYWSFDGCVWALGYIGGAHVPSTLDAIEAEKPNRAVRSHSIYEGVMPKEARAAALDKALAGARALLARADPGCWRARMMGPPKRPTSSRPKVGGAGGGKLWDMRVQRPK
ncbi:MAG: hypothetical protein Q8O67_00295 [Deltaproteobacteria bacterium]|nr:hypothetical protein [Deltaproteobacteria bacterium]